MTIRQMLNSYTHDVDIIDTYADDFMIAWCGTNLTDIGRITYRDILDLEVEKVDDSLYAIIIKYPRQHRMVKQMFYSMAGYCFEDDWDKLFYDTDC